MISDNLAHLCSTLAPTAKLVRRVSLHCLFQGFCSPELKGVAVHPKTRAWRVALKRRFRSMLTVTSSDKVAPRSVQRRARRLVKTRIQIFKAWYMSAHGAALLVLWAMQVRARQKRRGSGLAGEISRGRIRKPPKAMQSCRESPKTAQKNTPKMPQNTQHLSQTTENRQRPWTPGILASAGHPLFFTDHMSRMLETKRV